MSNDLNRSVEFQNAPSTEGSWDFLGFIWRRKLIVALVTVVGVGLGYLYFQQQVPVYKSTAQILIIKEQNRLPIDGMEFSPGYDPTHETIIRSPMVIEKAAKDPRLTSLKSLQGSGNPTGQIISGFTVTGGGGRTGDILTLGYESQSREDCPVILEAVIDAYKSFLGTTHDEGNKETLRLVSEAKDLLDSQIKDLTVRYAEFRRTSPLISSAETSQNVHEARLQRIEQVRSEAVLNNSQLQAQIDAIESALNRGASREALNLMVDKLAQSNGTPVKGPVTQQSVEELIFPLLLQEQEMLESHNYGPDHPQLRMLRKKIQVTRDFLLGRKEAEAGEKSPENTTDFYKAYLDSLREKILLNKQTITSMDDLFAFEQDASRNLTSYQIEDATFRSELGQKKRLFDVLMNKLEGISLTQNAGGARVEVIYRPSGAGQVRPEMKSILMGAGMLGALAGLALAFLIDSADRRFRSPEEIRSDFGLPVFGHIPVIVEAVEKARGRKKKEKNAVGGLSPALSVHHQSKGRIAEAYRGVRTAVFFSNRISGHKVFQVTSPSPGDGKTTLTCNLAISIANAGKKVLLVDADFRRPRVHAMFGVKTDTGMSSVIEGTVELDDAILETPIENLHILPCGPRPGNPAELLSSHRFEELLQLLREKYDCVLVDSPPILAVTDPLNVAPRVDGVLLVMRLTKTARHNGHRALSAIEGIGANVLGIVVNGVGKTEGYGYDYGYGYGYGSDRYGRYGRTYSYGGQYGSSYGYGDDKSYYTDDDGAKVAALEHATHHHNGNDRA